MEKWKILAGIWNKIRNNAYVETVYTERRNICEQCPSIDYEGSSCVVSGTQPCCKECGCSLSIKLRSLSTECPLGKWKAVMTEEEEDKLNLN